MYSRRKKTSAQRFFLGVLHEVESDKAQRAPPRHPPPTATQPIVHDKLRAFWLWPLPSLQNDFRPPFFTSSSSAGLPVAGNRLRYLLLRAWQRKKNTEATKCHLASSRFICIPALPSAHVGFYELAQAKH